MTDPSTLKSDPAQHHDVSDWRAHWLGASYAAGKVCFAFGPEVLRHRASDPLSGDVTKHVFNFAIGSGHADQLSGDVTKHVMDLAIGSGQFSKAAEAVEAAFRSSSKAVEAALRQDDRWQAVIGLLGNPQPPDLAGTLLGHSPLHAHIAAQQGLPYSALFFLLDHAKALNEYSVAHILDISVRTLHRQRTKAEQAMPVSIGSKTLQLAETIALAQDVFGSREEAERWLQREVMGLDGHRPIDLLATPQGASMVLQFLERLQYGVYT